MAILAVPDCVDLSTFTEVCHSLPVWEDLGFSFHIRRQELTSILRRTRAQQKDPTSKHASAALRVLVRVKPYTPRVNTNQVPIPHPIGALEALP